MYKTMIKRLVLSLFLLMPLCFWATPASAQMSDDAVYQYVEDGLKHGKSQEQLVKKLTAKGVTKSQAMRIKQRLENAQIQQEMTADTDNEERIRLNPEENPEGTELEAAAPVIGRRTAEHNKNSIFGMDLFSNHTLSFTPNENIATPENYILGPGDEVIVDIWGTNQATIRSVISPEGSINITDIGPVYLSGKNIKDAENYLKLQLNKIYSVYGDEAQSEIKLSLGRTRTIMVNVLGEVNTPGTYFLSSFSSIYHALYRAGGISELGNLRDIRLIRNGKVISHFDIYELILEGNTSADINLLENDNIVVPPYETIVSIDGKVKRPMKYEMKDGVNVSDLIEYAGGFAADAYKANLNVTRMNGDNYQTFTVEQNDYASFKLLDGDIVSIGEMNNRFFNKLEISGAVYHPGIYQLSPELQTVKQLIDKADGIMGNAFGGRALLYREQEDYSTEVLPIDIKGILDGSCPDIKLRNNDRLFISSINDIKDRGTITIEGEVAFPGQFDYTDNTTVEDIIILAGGLMESASTARIEVSRRIKNSNSTVEDSHTAELFSFGISENLTIKDGGEKFILKPYDHIYVRKSPGYSPQIHVTVNGEVLFPGKYALTNKNERLSDLVKKAGGVNEWAYVKGSRLQRIMNADEKARALATRNMVSNIKDSVVLSNEIGNTYSVGINLVEAINNPGSVSDVVLREGDVLIVPEIINTVRISGDVMLPNTVTYNPELGIKEYVNLAGGYGFRAKKSKAFIVYINGNVARASNKHAVIEPGCEIIVPQKDVNEKALQQFLSVSTTAASLATMIATIGNIIVRGYK